MTTIPALKAASSVQRQLMDMTDGLQSGEDSGLKTLWDEYCVQVQGEHFAFFGLYEDMVCGFAEAAAEQLTQEERLAIWLVTREGEDWEPADPFEKPPIDMDSVTNQIIVCVNDIAVNYRSAAIDTFLGL